MKKKLLTISIITILSILLIYSFFIYKNTDKKLNYFASDTCKNETFELWKIISSYYSTNYEFPNNQKQLIDFINKMGYNSNLEILKYGLGFKIDSNNFYCYSYFLDKKDNLDKNNYVFETSKNSSTQNYNVFSYLRDVLFKNIKYDYLLTIFSRTSTLEKNVGNYTFLAKTNDIQKSIYNKVIFDITKKFINNYFNIDFVKKYNSKKPSVLTQISAVKINDSVINFKALGTFYYDSIGNIDKQLSKEWTNNIQYKQFIDSLLKHYKSKTIYFIALKSDKCFFPAKINTSFFDKF